MVKPKLYDGKKKKDKVKVEKPKEVVKEPERIVPIENTIDTTPKKRTIWEMLGLDKV